MKKILLSILTATLVFAGCATFDDPKSELYKDGPEVKIIVTETADSTFNVTITPDNEAQWYSFVIDEADSAEQLDPATLLKGGYTSVLNAVLEKTEDAHQYITDMRNAKGEPLCKPNTTYVIYAIAVNDKGNMGQIATAVVKTTDSNAPEADFDDYDYNEDGSVGIYFTEAVSRGAGRVYAILYKDNDFENPDTVDAVVTIEDDVVSLSLDSVDAHPGVYAVYCYEAGAFVDATGKECGLLESYFNEEEGEFVGVWSQVDYVDFAITDKMLAPADGTVFPKWEEFKGVIKFDFPVYSYDENKELGDLSVTYATDSRKTTIKLAPENWYTEDSTLVFTLPEAPAPGAKVTVSIINGAIMDVYGNYNEAFTSETSWKCFAMTKDMILGDFDFHMVSKSSGKEYNMGTVTIEENPEEEDCLTMKNLICDSSEVKCYYDIPTCKLFIPAYEILGIEEDEEGQYGIVTYPNSSADYIEFDINADGTISSNNFSLAYTDEAIENLVGYYMMSENAYFTPVAPAKSAAKRVARATESRNARVKFNRSKSLKALKSAR